MTGETDSRRDGLVYRLLILGLLVAVVFLFLLIRLVKLQLEESDFWVRKAQDTSYRQYLIPAERGRIWDRSKIHILADNETKFSLSFVPAEIDESDISDLAVGLADIFNLNPTVLLNAFKKNLRSSWAPVDFLEDISLASLIPLAEATEHFPGIIWNPYPSRTYPYKGSISHIVGYTRRINSNELATLYNQGYRLYDDIGKTGIEQSYDSILRGVSGRSRRTVDSSGRVMQGDSTVEHPQLGSDLVLSIDYRIQKVAEAALGARKGSVVVLRPESGEILAMVSFPAFDPGNLNSLSEDRDDAPYLNRAIQSMYPPASTFKLIMAAAILGEDAIDPSETIFCNGYIYLGNRKFWCWKKSGHGPVNLQTAIEQSCNIYFGTVGTQYLGAETIMEYAREFGLGSLSGVDLPGEQPGRVPTLDGMQSTRGRGWMPGDTLNISIGQGDLLVTPLQMANVIAIIANEGSLYQPHVGLSILNGDKMTPTDLQVSEPVRKIEKLTPDDWQFLKQAMRSVVTQGTAQFSVFGDSVEIGGKTGTAEIGLDDSWHDWFVSLAPIGGDPGEQIVVVVQVEANEEYESWSAKAADLIIEAFFSGRSYSEVVSDWQDR
ncbi:MAG: penicillin-binding protein 2, partial [Spirochaetaceae bacterium]|nr:penicillin-binding protein 2 [Spirochaetaceae bacterium]